MRRYFILGGATGPALFGTLIILCGSLRPGYNHVTQVISELGETGGPFSALMNYVGFMSSATLILLFAVTLVPSFPRSVLPRIGATLVAIFAVNMFAAGIFSCDAGCLREQPTTEQLIHGIVSIIAFLALILAALVWGSYFLRFSRWRRFGIYSVATALLSAVLFVALITSDETRIGTGLLQRLFLGVLFIWLGSMSWRLWRGYGGAESV